MKRLTAAATAILLLQGLPALAEGFSENLNDLPSASVIKSANDGTLRKMRPTLNSSEIAAIQYHEGAGVRCQTQEGVFVIYPLRPTDATCVVNGQTGVMMP